MLIRTWLLAGTVLVVLTWALLVPWSPADFQRSVPAQIGQYRSMGLVPAVDELEMSDAIGHEVFELPAADEEHAKAAMARMAGMAGMAGMGAGEMPGMKGAGEAAGHAESQAGMEMAGGGGGEMPGMKGAGEAAGHAESATGMAMAGAEAGHGAGDGEHAGGYGLEILAPSEAAPASRTVSLEMAEWGFTPSSITVKPGEIVRFVVHNGGNLPHEFMFMPSFGMETVGYRLTRADWTLTEHEAIFERSLYG